MSTAAGGETIDDRGGTMTKLLAGVGLTALAIGASLTSASAQQWTGTTSNNWTVGSNWSGGVAPSGGSVVINTTSPNPTVLGVSGPAIGVTSSLYVGDSGSGSLTIQNGSTLTSASAPRIGNQASGTGTVTVTGAGSLWTISSGNFGVGYQGNGTLNVVNGGKVVASTTILGVGVTSSGTLNISGGMLDTAVLRNGFGAAQANFDNGILKARANNATFINGFSGTELSVLAGGLTVDTAGFTVGTDATSGFTGAGGLTVTGGGIFNLLANSPYSGETWIQAGSTLSLQGAGAVADSSRVLADGTFDIAAITPTGTSIQSLAGSGAVTLGAKTLTITDTNDSFSGIISGSGGLALNGGTMILGGANTYSGATTVSGGKLVVEGALGNTQTTVNSGGTLGGSGSIAGAVIIADGGVLAPGSSPGTLTVGSLSLSSGSTLDYELGQAGIVGGGVNDLIVVTGNLTLDGSLDITDVGGFGPGVYRLINYGGSLTDNGLEFGNLPVNVTAADLSVQTSVANQVNLISSVGNDLLFWDGDAAGNANNDLVDGGNGTWTATSPNWTTSTGLVNGAMKPQPGFAIFQTLGGTVIAGDGAGALAVTGMQFAADGYRIEGDATTLAGAGGESIIRVGDGSPAGAGYTATIASVLTGASSLTKTDAGTLVLSGANTYTGGTTVSGGVLSVSADNNLGAAAGGLTLAGGTLRNTAVFFSARDITLAAAGGTFDTAADLILSGAISGAGSLAKTGAGTLTLTGTNSYGGNTLVDAGTLVGNAASIRGDIGNAGTVVFDQTADASFAGDISGTGTMVKDGAGTLTLAGTSLLDWTIDQGGLVSAAERFGGDV
ncbi:autotransporter-associated beta strand repeat-containing protein, partial [Mesorhizobium sp. M1406]|uniref:beta strand repeat-containing protein n=1 Tax=Mesorhizobium sp. M1406 TaxID=2957099 RepID=UPI0033392E95